MSLEKDSLGKAKKVKPVETDSKPEKVVNAELNILRHIYNSPSQIQRHFQEEPGLQTKLERLITRGSNNSWVQGSFTPERAIECATLGLLDSVELIKAEKRRAEKLDVQVVFPSWQADMAGAFPDVGAFIAGDPLSMRRMVNQVSDTRPIRIFVGMASSCSFTAEQLAKRGALVSALALQLAKTRSVEIFAVNAGSKRGQNWVGMVRLPMPASASDLCYWICHQASVRGLLYAVETWFTGTLTWPDMLDLHTGNYFTPEAIAAQAKLFGAGPSDIVVPFPHGTDPAMLDPEKWMRQTLQRVNAI